VLFLLRMTNIVLLLALVGCLAGAMAGLIVFAPFVAGAWLLNLVALLGVKEHAPPRAIERTHGSGARAESRVQLGHASTRSGRGCGHAVQHGSRRQPDGAIKDQSGRWPWCRLSRERRGSRHTRSAREELRRVGIAAKR
jgi:hypothetical protein